MDAPCEILILVMAGNYYRSKRTIQKTTISPTHRAFSIKTNLIHNRSHLIAFVLIDKLINYNHL